MDYMQAYYRRLFILPCGSSMSPALLMDSEEVRLAHGAVSSLTAGTGYSAKPAGISRENSPVGFRKVPRSGIGFEGFGVS